MIVQEHHSITKIVTSRLAAEDAGPLVHGAPTRLALHAVEGSAGFGHPRVVRNVCEWKWVACNNTPATTLTNSGDVT
jgi:hypothetical protein